MPIFFFGFIGGTVYHATRSHEFWLLLDWVPIVLLLAACAVYFALRLPVSLWGKLLVIASIFALNVIPRVVSLPEGYRISIGYIGTAVAVLFPIVFYAYKNNWKNMRFIAFAVASFLTAVGFRTLDKKYDLAFLNMGTHWLWHCFGAVAVFFLMQYIYLDIEKKKAL
ncbi:hypothetical protein [Nonlabens xiamenensis]|uniref:hypothetical protein n=1 Tax=Nonlabens xiamenensis TaxID=2341043 RepID=UPI001F0CA7B6|nr:hypothetical protein [Nonlabens xiamenensis]